MEYCLVTGAAGFIGSWLAERLVHLGNKVIGIDSFEDFYPRGMKERNLEKLKKDPNFIFYEANLLTFDLNSIVQLRENPVTIFHLAAQAGVRASWGKDFKTYFNNNVLATQKLLDIYRKLPVKKFIYASSSSVYGNIKELPMGENAPCKPISPYGVTKLAGEKLCHHYFTNYQLPVVMLRYFTVYGPRQRPDMAFHKFIKAILEDKQIEIYGVGSQTRDFTYINDAIKATILLSSNGKPGEIYNIGGGSRITVNETLHILEKIIGKPVKVVHIGEQNGDVKHTFADIAKSKRELNYSPSHSFEEGLSREVTWLKENLTKSPVKPTIKI